MPRITYVYVDGFNFYYGSVKDTSHKWVDFGSLFRRLLGSQHQIDLIKYFTARVKPLPHNPDAPKRQQTFIRAIEKYIPELEVIYGKFKVEDKWLPLADSAGPQLRSRADMVSRVKRTEEKGSDVNLAVHMVHDGWKGLYDCAAVVSNDADLGEALRIVKAELNKEVILLTPYNFRHKRVKILKNNSDRWITIKPLDVRACQLPSPIPQTKIHKPAEW